MLRVAVLFAFISCVFAGAIPNDWQGRIVNGANSTIEAHPYQVSLQTNNGFHFCGGCIISEDIIVTAAHCMQKYKAHEFKVRLGSTEYNNGGELVAVKSFRYHEGYHPKLMVNDVAIIKLSSPVRQSSKVRYLKLAQMSPATGTTAVVTGWGSKCFLFCDTSPQILQAVYVDIVGQQRCCSDEFKYGDKIKDSMLCAYGVRKDSCQGDSGGPLVVRNELVGIVSWGFGCAIPGYPGVYCNVANVYRWIEKTSKEL